MSIPHILYLIDVLCSTRGGAEGVLWQMTRHLPRDRFRCSVATFSPDSSLVPVDQFPCRVHLLPIQRTYDWRAMRAAMALHRLIVRERIDIVHTFFPASDLLGALVAKLSGRRRVISSRRDMGLLRHGGHELVYRWARPLFDQVQAVSDEVRQYHIRHDGLDPAKVFTVFNGVDAEDFDRMPAAADACGPALEPLPPLVTCVANIRPVKGLEVLVRTAGLVCRQLPDVRFIVVGEVHDQRHFAELKALAASLGVGHAVLFPGSTDHVGSILKSSRVFLLPSHSEGLSNAMLEAMACRLPCVATAVGGNRELVRNGTNGYLVAANDPQAAAGRVLELLADPSRAAEMGRAGRALVEQNFSMAAMIQRLVELYDRVLEGHRPKGVETAIPDAAPSLAYRAEAEPGSTTSGLRGRDECRF